MENTRKRIQRLLVALLSAAFLGTALAPVAATAAQAGPAKAAAGADDKCKQIKNKKKRKRCFAKHHNEGGAEDPPNHG